MWLMLERRNCVFNFWSRARWLKLVSDRDLSSQSATTGYLDEVWMEMKSDRNKFPITLPCVKRSAAHIRRPMTSMFSYPQFRYGYITVLVDQRKVQVTNGFPLFWFPFTGDISKLSRRVYHPTCAVCVCYKVLRTLPIRSAKVSFRTQFKYFCWDRYKYTSNI